MTQEEAITAREVLVGEQRKLRLSIKILQSESIIPCAGVTMAIGQYNRRLAQIDNEIRQIADEYALTLQEEEQACEVEFQMSEETPAEPVTQVETAETQPVEETTASIAETATEPVQPAQQQFTEQQIADAFVQLARLLGIR